MNKRVSEIFDEEIAHVTPENVKERVDTWLSRINEFWASARDKIHKGDPTMEEFTTIHRAALLHLMFEGEILKWVCAPDAYAHNLPVLQAKIDEMMKELVSWHGPLEMLNDIPESFKNAMREVAAGKLEDLEAGGLFDEL